MSDYTPSTEEIRRAYALKDDEIGHPVIAVDQLASFDRWLAAHDSQVRAEVQPVDLVALRELAEKGVNFDANPTMLFTTASEMYTQWQTYMRRIDESWRAQVAAALHMNHTDGGL